MDADKVWNQDKFLMGPSIALKKIHMYFHI